jgi:hypothetical protein
MELELWPIEIIVEDLVGQLQLSQRDHPLEEQADTLLAGFVGGP